MSSDNLGTVFTSIRKHALQEVENVLREYSKDIEDETRSRMYKYADDVLVAFAQDLEDTMDSRMDADAANEAVRIVRLVLNERVGTR